MFLYLDRQSILGSIADYGKPVCSSYLNFCWHDVEAFRKSGAAPVVVMIKDRQSSSKKPELRFEPRTRTSQLVALALPRGGIPHSTAQAVASHTNRIALPTEGFLELLRRSGHGRRCTPGRWRSGIPCSKISFPLAARSLIPSLAGWRRLRQKNKRPNHALFAARNSQWRSTYIFVE